jgi:predicted nucleotidyltransferase
LHNQDGKEDPNREGIASVDLAFVRHKTHRCLLHEAFDQALRGSETIGVLLCGSVARQDAYPGSDLDVLILLREGCSRPFHSEVRQGILVERAYADLNQARAKLERNPMRVYAYLDGRILYDPEGKLAQLTDLARACLASYEMSAEDKHKLAYWLESARYKMIAAREAGDLLQAAFVASATSWKMLEGLWALNDRPMPSAGAVRAHIQDLTRRPPALEDQWRSLFVGDAPHRVQAAIDVIEWVVPRLVGE